jgi:hypothetical protein
MNWKTYYREELLGNNMTIPLFLLVSLVHYACCNDVWNNITTTSIHNITVADSHHIETPFLHLYANKVVVEEIPKEDIIPPLEEPVPSKWATGFARAATEDPFTFIYTSINQVIEPTSTKVYPSDESCEIDNNIPVSSTIHHETDSELVAQPIFDIFGISTLSFMITWLPSVYTPFACKSNDIWLMGNCVLIIYFSSWTFCIITYTIFNMHRLAYCMTMHICVQQHYILSALVFNCHDVPIYIPKILGNILGFGTAVILFYVLHACGTHLSFFNSLEFYMSHVWALLAVEIMRCTLYRIISAILLKGS